MFAPSDFNSISSCFHDRSGSEAPTIVVGTLRCMSHWMAGKKSEKYLCSCGWAMKQAVGGATSGSLAASASAAAASSSAGAAGAAGFSSLAKASCSVPRTIRTSTRRSSSIFDSRAGAPLGSRSACGSGSRALSGPSSPRKPIMTTSSSFTPGSRAMSSGGFSHLSSQLDDAPKNQRLARSWPSGRQLLPSTASCSRDHSVVRVSARPQSKPSQAGVSPRS
mmetsp:Transcript_121360/g.329512  ORF Transcript_121360/g.329512 Transcript_121360/m.329512 type:complete len:221 (+) Transcript_121360:244-906(+)